MTSPERFHHAGPPQEAGPEPAPRTRGGPRTASRAFRPRRTVPATLTALALAVAAILALVGAVAAAAGGLVHAPQAGWLTPLDRLHWDDPSALATASVAVVLGFLLLAAALIPGRPRAIPLASEDPQILTGITRSGLCRHVAAVAGHVPGVSGARARLRGRRLHVTATTPLRDPGELPGQVAGAVSARLSELRPLKPVKVDVSIRRKEG
ncbi:DUF6286 domain-containing protein [Sphaerisporangium fuscum]|uniref:DUF6286 domain-containing protein n=1 Tax=Sphaerisporangium fuscum TaxID=2835868 RepID=UPI001BDC65FC|nr:DUF6286 domain-containing protein [Sphaerisporangium fuscum]